jgi:hypothetical protein
MNLIIILALFVGWFVVATVITIAFGMIAEGIRERTKHSPDYIPLEYGDYEQVYEEQELNSLRKAQAAYIRKHAPTLAEQDLRWGFVILATVLAVFVICLL